MYGYIYLIKDGWTNKIYIGQKKGIAEQTTKYMGSGKIIKQVVSKRPHHLEKRILGYCESKIELDKAEKVCIDFYNSRNPLYGYNITSGGEGHDTFGFLGKKHSIESKIKIHNSNAGKYDKSGSRNPMFNKTHSEKTRTQISQARQGKALSNETKLKISAKTKGSGNGRFKFINEDTKKQLMELYQIGTSINKISKLIGLSRGKILSEILATKSL